jgi:hypothetical protein
LLFGAPVQDLHVSLAITVRTAGKELLYKDAWHLASLMLPELYIGHG